jgi:murein peptide amidase A
METETKKVSHLVHFAWIGILLGAAPSWSAPLASVRPSPTPSAHPVLNVSELCDQLVHSFKKYGWDLKQPCEGSIWKSDRLSHENRPLIYAEYGNPKSVNRTLILSMVHPDEITPLYLGFHLAQWVKENSQQWKDHYVVIAPLVNPDGLFRKNPIRMNSRGVDLNRNFDTKDWQLKALKVWKVALKKNPRRFPGNQADSESETHFQRELIERFSPVKILSIHAPLNVLDYDGPSSLALNRFPKEYIQECLRLRNQLKAKSTGYFPGSLGNFAGQEKGIPTITLELPSANPRKASEYWKKFQVGIQNMIEYKIDSASEVAKNFNRE